MAELHLSYRDYYAVLDRLEALNLVAIERYPGNRVRRGVEITAQGKSALQLAQGLRAAVEGSQAALELKMAEEPPQPGSEEAGAILLRLLEYAERRADYAAMKEIGAAATRLGRPGEAAFAAGLAAFLNGEKAKATRSLEGAVKVLASEKRSRSYRRAAFFHAATLGATGDDRRSYVELTHLRRLAQEAGDDITESDARHGIARLKAGRNQWADAKRHLEGALECAKRAGSLGRQAKVLTSLCLVDFMLDPEDGLPRSEEALQAARRSGAKILTMHIRANRALMFAFRRDKKAAAREMREARRAARLAGYETGQAALDGWAALSRRIARGPRKAYPQDLPGQVSALLNSRSTEPPEESLDSS